MTQLKTVAEVLDAAADLIEPEGAWTKGAFARDISGKDTSLFGYRGKAVCWCLLGATQEAAGDDDDGVADHFFAQFLGAAAQDGLACWNDAPERTQAEVVAKLREAAELARQGGL
ncbi:MAG: hypothetical protein EON59_00755 [Alphaproteobacteria bacterium]|nr:MAG: hypothetical protein EON59_00755 [Alphaproteobacteria bacterium]